MWSSRRPTSFPGLGILIGGLSSSVTQAAWAGEPKLDPPNFVFSSFSQGTGIMGDGQWDIEGNLYGMTARSSGLDVPASSGGGVPSAQVSVRRQVSGVTGLDFGLAAGGSYLSQGTTSGEVPSRGLSTFFTAHYAGKISEALGAGVYGQFGGTAQQSGHDSWIETSTAAITPVLAWEPEGGFLASIALNPVVASYAAKGALSQGPTLRNLVGVGVSFGIGVNMNDQLVLAPEISWVGSHGSALESGAQSARSDTYRIGLTGTFSYRGSQPGAPTQSVSVGMWYFEEDGLVFGPASPAAASGGFRTRGALLGITFGARRSVPSL